MWLLCGPCVVAWTSSARVVLPPIIIIFFVMNSLHDRKGSTFLLRIRIGHWTLDIEHWTLNIGHPSYSLYLCLWLLFTLMLWYFLCSGILFVVLFKEIVFLLMQWNYRRPVIYQISLCCENHMVKSCFCYRSELVCNVHCLLNCRTVRIKITFKYSNRSFVFPLAKRALQAILVSHNVSCFVQPSIRSTGSTKLPFRVGIANISLIEIFPCR